LIDKIFILVCDGAANVRKAFANEVEPETIEESLMKVLIRQRKADLLAKRLEQEKIVKEKH
jgi:hypothetical protein